jgi:hypothetical protein
MLVFIVPIKSKQLAKDWQSVSTLFERCLKSICNQTNPDFYVFVICNDRPEISFTHPQVTYLEREFSPFENNWQNRNLDRLRKVALGLVHARPLNPSHIVCVDADDCINRHLTTFVQQNPQAPGWYFSKGYVYQEGSQLIRLMRKGFDRYSSTSNIIRTDLFQLPPNFTETDCLQPITTPHPYLKTLFDGYRHREIIATLARQDTHLKPLPFPGGIYTRNGENVYFGISDQNRKISLKSRLMRLKSLLDFRWVSPSIRQNFGL